VSGFDFDPGTDRPANPYRIDRADSVLDAARDGLPADAPQAAVYAAAFILIRQQIVAYRTADSVRRALWTYAPIMAGMAQHAPAEHDELLLEILDRLDRLT
jgi:hypothetical protein